MKSVSTELGAQQDQNSKKIFKKVLLLIESSISFYLLKPAHQCTVILLKISLLTLPSTLVLPHFTDKKTKT